MSHDASSPASAPDRSGLVRARVELRLRESRSAVRPLDDRGIVLRLAQRAVDDTPVRREPGADVSAHALGVRDRVVSVKPAPNAPLLMRIVRTPYALAPGRARRLSLLDRTPPERPEPLGRPGRAWTENRAGALFRSPLRSVEHGLPQRLRPRRPAEGGAE
jgi:hypothetical protein